MYKSVAIQYNHHGVVCQLLRQYRPYCVCHPYLVSLLFTPSLYSLFFNLQNFLFSCLPSFFYSVLTIMSLENILITLSELVCASYEPIYVPIIIYCLRLFVVYIYVYNFVVILMLMNNVCVQLLTLSELV